VEDCHDGKSIDVPLPVLYGRGTVLLLVKMSLYVLVFMMISILKCAPMPGDFFHFHILFPKLTYANMNMVSISTSVLLYWCQLRPYWWQYGKTDVETDTIFIVICQFWKYYVNMKKNLQALEHILRWISS